jgi:hypothetical protein
VENLTAMTTRDWESELLKSNEGFDPPQGGTPRTPPARRPAVTEFKDGFPNELNVAA